MIEEIRHLDAILAMILRSNYQADGIKFFTPDSFTQQIGYMRHPEGHVIKPHVHCAVPREVVYTKEVLFIKSGRVRADFFDEQQNYIKSTVLEAGDFILLAYGGHGFKMLEKSEIIEVKQGPYVGEADKKRFDPIDESQVRF